MSSGDGIQLLILILLLLMSAFFSSAETALTTVNKIRVRTLAENGDKQAEYVLKIIEDPSKMLSAILIGNNVVNLYASSLATVLATHIWGNKIVGIATGILTLLILIFGEITPKTVATIQAERIAFRFAKIIYYIMTVLTPVIFVVNQLSFLVLKLLRVDVKAKGESITEDELRTIVEVSHEEGVIESEEKKMINNVFDFGDAVARDVMLPKVNMTFVDVDATYDELMEVFRSEKYTRYPVYEETTDNVIGIVNIKDLFLIPKDKEFKLRDYLREPYYTYEFKKTTELMVELRKTMNSVAIVLDEYGATAGLITLEDMLEEIVGEIRDEYDADEEDSIRKINPKEYVIEGAMKLDDLDDQLGLDLKSEDYDSVGGYIIGLLDHLPQAGEEVTSGNLRFVVDTVERNRIDKVHLYILDAPQKSEESEQESNGEVTEPRQN